jgi:hypothetical protein
MKKILVLGAGVIVIAALATVWLKAAAPTIDAVAATPAYLVINTPTTVRFTAIITNPAVQPAVNLLKVDASGKTLATVGTMNDNGANGDVVAGDKTFSLQTTINEPSVGVLHYMVSAPFKGVLRRTLSSDIQVTIDPVALPPDPGDAGKQTLEGIDSDHDGVRDDVQRYIALKYQSSMTKQAALTQYAIALQPSSQQSSNAIDAAVDAQVAAVSCIAYVFRDDDWLSVSEDLRAHMLNTMTRLRSYADIRMASSVEMGPVKVSELSNYCR